MFSPKTKSMFLVLPLCVVALLAANADAQSNTNASAQYQARMAAMQQAQARGQVVRQTVEAAPVRVAQATTTRVPRQMIPGHSMATPAHSVSHGYQPGHTRTAQLITDGAIIDGGAPILTESVITPTISAPGHSVVTNMIQGPVDGGIVYGEEIVSSCDSCGDSGSYFTDDCCGRGGCPDGVGCAWQGPLARSLGRALRTGSYFFGATAFRHPAFTSPVGTDLVQDSNFGAYGGFNLGIPLCRLFCGRISGQFGLRSVQTNFNGSDVSSSNRDQLFATAGLYRRVDYGLQAGLVVDVLAEEFYSESDVAQLRGELSWVYPTGSAIGFRFASGQESDTSGGTFNGTPFTGQVTETQDHYRFFLRKILPGGNGWEELFFGWTDEDQFTFGADFDIPVRQYMALEAGFAYYLSDLEAPNSNLGPTRIDDAFNLYVGFAFRPQGLAYYRSYDRPLLPVADNGTMVLRRR